MTVEQTKKDNEDTNLAPTGKAMRQKKRMLDKESNQKCYGNRDDEIINLKKKYHTLAKMPDFIVDFWYDQFADKVQKD